MSWALPTTPAAFYVPASGGSGGQAFNDNLNEVLAGDVIIWKLSWQGATTSVTVSDGAATTWNRTSDVSDATQLQTWVYTLASVQTGTGVDYTITHGADRAERRYQLWHLRPTALPTFAGHAGTNGNSSTPDSGALAVAGTDILALGGVETWNNSSPLPSVLDINGVAAVVAVGHDTSHGSFSFAKDFASGFTGNATSTIDASDIWLASIIAFAIGAGTPAVHVPKTAQRNRRHTGRFMRAASGLLVPRPGILLPRRAA